MCSFFFFFVFTVGEVRKCMRHSNGVEEVNWIACFDNCCQHKCETPEIIE